MFAHLPNESPIRETTMAAKEKESSPRKGSAEEADTKSEPPKNSRGSVLEEIRRKLQKKY